MASAMNGAGERSGESIAQGTADAADAIDFCITLVEGELACRSARERWSPSEFARRWRAYLPYYVAASGDGHVRLLNRGYHACEHVYWNSLRGCLNPQWPIFTRGDDGTLAPERARGGWLFSDGSAPWGSRAAGWTYFERLCALRAALLAEAS